MTAVIRAMSRTPSSAAGTKLQSASLLKLLLEIFISSTFSLLHFALSYVL